MDKLKMHSPDLSQDNIAKIRELFPGCVTEAKDEATGKIRLAVDFDQLRQELSDSIVEGPQERYRLDWPGKREALALANAPIAKSLRPTLDESSQFEQTENIFIEGDNLEALKLLQETYLGKIKMIYIDPPYNTGNDFIYDDDFSEDTEAFLQRSNQMDESRNRLVANTNANGRFHSDWISMIYSRIKLAKNLLANDGVIFISIDDVEVDNLCKVCDEIFGAENRIGLITVVSNLKGRSDDKYYATSHNYLLAYQKKNFISLGVPLPDEYLKEYQETTPDGRRYRLQGLRKRGDSAKRIDRPKMHYPFYVNPLDNSVSLQKSEQHSIEVLPLLSDGEDGRWRWGRETSAERISELCARTVGANKRYDIFQIDYAEGENGEKRIKPKTVWTGNGFANETGSLELKSLFGKKFFDTPKPIELIKYCLQHATHNNDLVLDFFAGSSTTAHAVMQLNSEDGGRRKFIMVQLPEPCDEKSDAFKAGYGSIADISKERIRRAGQKILESDCHPDWNRDVGFRVLKVDTSNMKDIYYRPDELSQGDLLEAVDNVKPDRTPEDLLFQVLVDWGVDLTLPIRRESMQGKTVFFVDDNALVACFDTGITEELVKELAKHEPLRVVFRDNGFVSDAVKINVEQIFRQLSPSTEVRAI